MAAQQGSRVKELLIEGEYPMYEDGGVTYENPMLNTIASGDLTVTNFRVLFTSEVTCVLSHLSPSYIIFI